MSAHALLSPSKRYRWANCPGSIREEAKYPEQPSSPAAIDGTHTHTLLEFCIRETRDPSHYVGTKLDDHEGEFVVDDVRADRARIALTYIYSRKNELRGECKILSERKVNPEFLLGRDDMAGTVDVQILGGGVIELIDYKDGMGDAWEAAKLQLEQYAYGVLSALKIPVNQPYPYHTVRMTVIQPKLTVKGIPAVRSIDVSVTELLNNIGTIVMQAHATDQPDAPLIPGDLQCKYCPVKGCSARMNVITNLGISFPVLETVAMTTELEPKGALDLAQQSANKDPHAMTVEQLSQILEAAPLVRQLLEAAEAEALARLKAGTTVPGFKVVMGRGSRKWALPEEEMAEKLIKMGIPKGEVYETKLRSISAIEKLKWTKKKAGEEVKVQLSERQLATLNKEYVAHLSGAQTVAPESDSRPAITFNAAPMFSAVEATPAPVDELPAFLQTPSWLLANQAD